MANNCANSAVIAAEAREDITAMNYKYDDLILMNFILCTVMPFDAFKKKGKKCKFCKPKL
jgi:hypothetical protein